MDVRAIQEALRAHGFDPGPIDGIFGRRTIAAVKEFQRAKALNIKWPGTVGPKTIAALLGQPVDRAMAMDVPPWFKLAGQKKGLQETDPVLKAFLKSDKKTLGDPARLPWCGDLVETCIALTLPDEPMVTNPYLARNWLKFGLQLEEPAIGAVLVFWRGKRLGTSGHVGFYAGEDRDRLIVRGGNQSNRISDAPLARNRLLGVRWPSTYPLPTGGRVHAEAGGPLSTDEA